jgi:hypothetical protein
MSVQYANAGNLTTSTPYPSQSRLPQNDFQMVGDALLVIA